MERQAGGTIVRECRDVSPNLVIASAAKQSRVPPRKDSGLLRCARNDEVGIACPCHTLAVIARLDRAIQYSEAAVIHGEAAAYWIPRSSAQLRTRRGMTLRAGQRPRGSKTNSPDPPACPRASELAWPLAPPPS